MSLQFCEWEDNDVHDIPYTSDVGKSTFHNDKCALRDNLLFAMILTIVANNLAFLFVIKYCLSGAFSFETSWQSHSLVFASQDDDSIESVETIKHKAMAERNHFPVSIYMLFYTLISSSFAFHIMTPIEPFSHTFSLLHPHA